MDLGLDSKTALLLGGSQGHGLGVTRALLEEGARAMISSRPPDGLTAARDGLPVELRDCCHLASYIKGSIIRVDGGRYPFDLLRALMKGRRSTDRSIGRIRPTSKVRELGREPRIPR